jgi:hypothetical protein
VDVAGELTKSFNRASGQWDVLCANFAADAFAIPETFLGPRLGEETLLPQVWPDTWRTSRVAFAAGLRSEA